MVGEIKTARVFAPLVDPARYKGAHGGRGSGKSHFFATLLVEFCAKNPGTRAVCIREHQKSLAESAKRLIEDKIQALGVGHMFTVQNEKILTPGGGTIIFMGMKDHTAESIKSLEGFQICWVEEAQTLSQRSLDMLRPTIRNEGSEIWFSWNPRSSRDPVDQFLRGDVELPNGVVVQANYADNPWLPKALDEERQTFLATDPDKYGHVWLGEYQTFTEGAYFASQIALAKEEGRITDISRDPLMQINAFWDIGGTGARADARAIWIVQFVGQEVRLLDYQESIGQELASDINWLRSRDFGNAHMVLPHDGSTHDRVYNVSYQSALRDAGFNVTVVPNQGKGAANQRIEAARRIFPSCWFNKPLVEEAGLAALAHYHEKRDEVRNIGQGPEHDWSSHCADAFGLMAVFRERMVREQQRPAAPQVQMIPTVLPQFN